MSQVNKFRQLQNWFKSRNSFGQVLVLALLDQVILLSFGFLVILLFGEEFIDSYNPIAEESGLVFFIVAVIIAPWLETFIFQFGIVELLLLIFKRFTWVKVAAGVVSAVVFGLGHKYNPSYILMTLVIGIYYAVIYLYFRPEGKKKAFQMVAFVHMFRNMLAFLLIVINK